MKNKLMKTAVFAMTILSLASCNKGTDKAQETSKPATTQTESTTTKDDAKKDAKVMNDKSTESTESTETKGNK